MGTSAATPREVTEQLTVTSIPLSVCSTKPGVGATPLAGWYTLATGWPRRLIGGAEAAHWLPQLADTLTNHT